MNKKNTILYHFLPKAIKIGSITPVANGTDRSGEILCNDPLFGPGDKPSKWQTKG